jgi:hypothetical protein
MKQSSLTSAQEPENGYSFTRQLVYLFTLFRMKTKKKFDAIKMMRDIRSEIDNEISGMSVKQLMEYLQKARSEYQKAIAAP